MKKAILLIILFLCSSYSPSGYALQLQSSGTIETAVIQHISSNLTTGTDYKINRIQFDKGLKLPLCSVKLETFGQLNAKNSKRNSIGVKCHGKKKWTIYTSVLISIYKDVIVLTQPVQRGEIIDKNILQFEKKDISQVRSGYLTDPTLIINKQATRNLSAGTVINKSNLKNATIIKRGEKIYITANSLNLNISMAGIAMMNGSKGQNIKVKNINSQQIIQATVTKPGQVAVMF